MSVLRLGTRKSLLALAQSKQVAQEIERQNAGIQVELVGISTRGDQVQDIPLSQMEGRDFFVKEIDEALIQKKVDFTVHSFKDLSLDRPGEIQLAAVPKREPPHDVILFSQEVSKNLLEGKKLKIGSSSPRRMENIPPFLEKALPQNSTSPKIQMVEIRGNVTTRLERIFSSDPSKKLDGVVLALAGLNRLWKDQGGKKVLTPLLEKSQFMVLPLMTCPGAPAQGALALECRKDDSKVLSLLRKVHHSETQKQIERERKLLEREGGGCHQRFGATARQIETLGTLLHIRGKSLRGQWLDETAWEFPPSPTGTALPWDSTQERNSLFEVEELDTNLPEKKSIFVSRSNAWRSHFSQSNQQVWCAGEKSWFALAKKGVWVSGCGEGFGFQEVEKICQTEVLQFPFPPDWVVLTHAQAVSRWDKQQIQALGTYQLKARSPLPEIGHFTHFFWMSVESFELMKPYLPKNAHHSCGPGKTFSSLREKGITPLAFPNKEIWNQWLEKKNGHDQV